MSNIETRISKSQVSKSRVSKLEYRNVEYRNSSIKKSSIKMSSIKTRVSKCRVLKLKYQKVKYQNVEYRNSSIEMSSIEMSSIETRISKSRVSKSRVSKLEYRNVEYRNSSIEMSSIEKSKFESRESIKSAMLHTSLMSFCCSKSTDIEILDSLAKVRGAKAEKRHSHNFEFFIPTTESAWAQHGLILAYSMAGSKNQYCGGVLFSFTSNFTLTANNSTLKTPTHKNFHIIIILRR